jgi:hypothetical protein
VKRHVIEEIRFEPRANDGPLRCRCGWSGMASVYDEHTGRGVPPTCPQGHIDWERNAAGARRCRTCRRAQQKQSEARARARKQEVYA